MNAWKVLTIVLLVSVWQSLPMSVFAAQKGASGQKAATNSAAEKAMDECTAQFCGRRSPSVTGYRPMLIEGCFKQKMGQYPAQMGVSLRPNCSIRN
ncbi:MAG TPA: hypothetical protein VH684_21265 [Xanthobacteraceae bacterium]|jgi:hypothetical protein